MLKLVMLKRFSKLLILFVFSLLIFTGLINSNVSTVAQEETASNAEIIYTYVKLDGRELFPVAVMAATNSNSTSRSLLPMNMRVKGYERQLQEIINRDFDPQNLTITVIEIDGQTTIVADDGKQLLPRKLVDVTELDAQIHGLSISSIAQQWSNIIHSALIQAQQERQPAYLYRQLLLTGLILLGITLMCCGLFLIWQKRLRMQWHNIKQQLENLDLKEIDTSSQAQLLAAKEQKTIWERQKKINILQRGLLQIGHIIAWLVGLTYIFGLFPYTRSLQGWLFTKWELVGIILGTYAAIKASGVVVDRILQGFIENDKEIEILVKRRKLRLTTFFHVLEGIICYALVFVGIFLILAHFRIPITPLLAGAGIVGFALSFGSQNLIRDIINGSLIVLEDQYAIGDVIKVGDAAGFVEDMNLRMTQLRGEGGRLTTIPNSNISIIHNLTKDWSRFDFKLKIPYEVDTEKAMAIIRQVAEQMQQDPEWQEHIIDPVNVLGINDILETGVEIILFLKTQPLKHLEVGREFRRRLKLAFEREGITIGLPKYLLELENHFKS